MASTFKLCIEEFVHYVVCHLRIDIASGHNQHIRIVVQTRHVGYFRNPHQCSSNTLVFVQSHRDTFATATNCNTLIHLTLLYATGQRMCKIRIVATVCRIRTIIFIFNSLGFKVLLYILFQLKTSMITCKSYHFLVWFYLFKYAKTSLWIFWGVNPSFSSSTL